MLSKCANPDCSASFRYLHQGRLFRFEGRNNGKPIDETARFPRGIEFFWLCDGCAGKFTVVSDAAKGTCVVELHRRALGAAAAR